MTTKPRIVISDEHVSRYLAKKLNLIQLSIEYECHEDTVRRVLQRQGVKLHPREFVIEEKYVALLKTGTITQRDLCKELGILESTLYRAMVKQGYKTKLI
jgi:lambda repressor-like predicted transcriptional regulator